MPDEPSSTANPDRTSRSATDPLTWWSLAPSVSIGVFVVVATFTIDSTASSDIIPALVVALLLGPSVSYLCDTTRPRTRTGAPPAPGGPRPRASS